MKTPIRVYETDLTLLTEIDSYETLYFERKLFESGNFEITINYNCIDAGGNRYADYLTRGRFILVGTNFKRIGVILEVQKSLGPNGKGSEQVLVKGAEAKVLLSRRVVYPPVGYANYTDSGAVESIIKDLLKAQIGSTAAASRQMSVFTIAADSARGDDFEYSSRYKNLADDLKAMCEASAIGISCTYDPVNNKIILDTIHGVDRTAIQSTNTRVIISTDYDTLKEATLTDSEVNYKNLVLAAGQGIGANRTIEEVYDTTEPTGVDRRELFADMRDLDTVLKLETRAASVLSERSTTKYVDAQMLTFSQYELDVDYALGDYITVSAYNSAEHVQLTGVTESWAALKYEIAHQYSRSYPELPKQIASQSQAVNQQLANTEPIINPVSGTATLPSTSVTGKTTITDTTEAGSASGALVVSGGIYAAKNIVTPAKVGIGITSFTDLLHVAGNDGTIRLTRGSGTHGLRIIEDYSGGGYIKFQVTDNASAWKNILSADEAVADASRKVVIAGSGGQVGIGKTPGYQLELSTDSAAKPSTNTWTVTSDERIKTDIELADLDRCYEIVKLVPLKHYRFRDDVYTVDQVRDRACLGWIAQDVETVFPKAVGQHELKISETETIPDCRDLNAGQLYAAMYGAIQKLQKLVEDQGKRIADLEALHARFDD